MPYEGGGVQRAFSGGEQSPLLGARADLARWQSSLELCENFITMVQGGATRRSGTADVYAAQANSRLIEFAFSGSDGYCIEVPPEPANMRFFRDFGVLLKDDLSGPYELASPFELVEVANFDFAQTADRLFITSGYRPMQQLQRLAQTNWSITDAAIVNGPFLDLNEDQSFTLTCGGSGEIPAGTTGLSVTASKPLFNSGHINAIIRIRVKDLGAHGKWQNEFVNAAGDIIEWDGNWYKKTGAVSTKNGDSPPVHLFGEAWDGPIVGTGASASKWLYLHSGFGVIRITAVADSTHATATAVNYVPDDFRSGTWRWEEGAWSGFRGFPQRVSFHKKRLWCASTFSQPTRVWASVIDDYINFDDSNTDDDKAFSFDLEADSGEVNFPQWIVSGKRLAIGTSHAEFVIGSADVTSPITATSVDPETDTNEGSAHVPAIKIDNPVFVSKDGKRVMELGYDIQEDKFVTQDLTIEAEHITGAGNVGVIRMAWLRDPYRLIAALRSDGMLLTGVYRKDQQVIGWHRHPMQGTVLDICRAPSPSGIRQDLWLKVQHVLPAGTVTRIECLKAFFERGDLSSASAWFVDGGISGSQPGPNTVWTCPGHLIGATVKIRADGKEVPDQVVADAGGGHGKIILEAPGARFVILGLKQSARLRTLRYDQRLQGKNARVDWVGVDLIRSGPVQIGVPGHDLQPVAGLGDAGTGDAEALITGIYEVPLEANWIDDGNVELVSDGTGPCTVRALIPKLQVAA